MKRSVLLLPFFLFCEKQQMPPLLEMGKITPKSVYQLGSSWQNQYGREVFLADLRGRQRVVAMFYSNCSSICPRTVSDLRRIEQKITGSAREKTGFVLVSLNPRKDSPEELRKYAGKMHITAENWTLLTGGADDVRSLAVLLGISYEPLADGEISHTAVFTLLDEQGEILFQASGIRSEYAELIAKIETHATVMKGK
jgi:protein SCO1